MGIVNCEVIEDILPIYVENMASLSTKALVEEHLASCEVCRRKKEQMCQTVLLPEDINAKALSNISKLLLRKKVTIVVITTLSMLLLTVLCLVHLNSPISIPYEDIADKIEIKVAEDDSMSILIQHSGGYSSDIEYGLDEDGVKVQYIRLYTTKMRQLLKVAEESFVFYITDIKDENEVKRVYYYPSIKNGEAVCIYEDEEVAKNTSLGVMVLPRLTLNYYTLFATLLSIGGIVCCIFLRKREKVFFTVWKITLLPMMYVISSMLITWNKNNIYDVGYYFSGILIATFVLYILAYWITEFIHYYKKL